MAFLNRNYQGNNYKEKLKHTATNLETQLTLSRHVIEGLFFEFRQEEDVVDGKVVSRTAVVTGNCGWFHAK